MSSNNVLEETPADQEIEKTDLVKNPEEATPSGQQPVNQQQEDEEEVFIFPDDGRKPFNGDEASKFSPLAKVTIKGSAEGPFLIETVTKDETTKAYRYTLCDTAYAKAKVGETFGDDDLELAPN